MMKIFIQNAFLTAQKELHQCAILTANFIHYVIILERTHAQYSCSSC